MFVHFTICNAKDMSPKNYRMYSQKERFSVIMGFQSANEKSL